MKDMKPNKKQTWDVIGEGIQMEEIKVKRVWEREEKRKWEGLNKTDG